MAIPSSNIAVRPEIAFSNPSRGELVAPYKRRSATVYFFAGFDNIPNETALNRL